ncbi:MFS transporter (macronuclear) [Tetrahymena thermophila SB210]|uniref:MFS transporter n=1 Tax=Tetrahymena thermophila (strain SB210) TaxID=312017 RepID=I7MAJ4_TETTS|nr:MFS transporter [Tetrahymena thermophila SB210]EAS04709.3 MFS transporter [Tetrahymena thermophila SB210]|eukprot:XP_001024954.3 MFS transporter [Tetrahymena thermophila SB210]
MSLSFHNLDDDERGQNSKNKYGYQDVFQGMGNSYSNYEQNQSLSDLKRPIMPREVVDQPIYQQNPMYTRLDSLPFSKWHYYAILALSGGLFIDGYEVAVVAVSSTELQRIYSASESQVSLLATAYMIGAGIGSLIFGYYSSEHGRKKVFYTTLAVYAISILFVIISRSLLFLYLVRFFSGIGIGGEYTAIFAMVDEIVPSSYRGTANICVSSIWHLGSSIAGLLGLAFSHRLNSPDDTLTWRFLFLFGALFIIPIIYLRKFIPESPRWINGKGKPTEADQIVDLITYCCDNDCIIPLEEYKILQQKPRMIGIHPQNYNDLNQDELPTNLFEIMRFIINRYRKRFALCFAIIFASNFVYKGIFYTHVMMMKKIDNFEQKEYSGKVFSLINPIFKSFHQTEQYFILPLICASFLGPLIMARFFDTQGRKRMIFFIFVASGVLLFINGILFDYSFINHNTQLIFWILIIFFSSPGISAAHLTISEVFPLKIRSQALALFNTVGLCAGGALAPYFFGVLIRLNSIDSLSLGYYCSSLIMITAGLLGLAIGIRAENLPLEEI